MSDGVLLILALLCGIFAIGWKVMDLMGIRRTPEDTCEESGKEESAKSPNGES